MIIFLYGDDIYRSNQKLKNLKAKYVEKYSDTNLETFEDNFDIGKIKEAVTALPFLADKRLVIIKNIFKSKSKELLDGISEILEYVPEETIVIFWESGVPDKRTVLFKKLIKERSEEFEKLQGISLTKWIQEDIEGKGGKISQRNATKLALYVGDDIWQLSSEIDKLISYKNGGEIQDEDIDTMLKARLTSNIFSLVDAMGERNYQKSMKYLHELIDQGEPEIYILTMIIRQFRNLILIKDYEGNLDKMGIAKEVGLHPFVVQKGMVQARNFKIQDLKNIYEKLQDTDIAIKTGGKEPLLALDILVKELC